MREALVSMALVLALAVAGCGGGGDGGEGADAYTKEDIAGALGFHRKAHETIYEMPPGKDCVVIRVLTTSDEVTSAQRVADNLPTALAVNSDGTAGVIFAGFGTSPRMSVLHRPSPTSIR